MSEWPRGRGSGEGRGVYESMSRYVYNRKPKMFGGAVKFSSNREKNILP